jgi:alpha-tubulin suppressor-like RCC1 family protein
LDSNGKIWAWGDNYSGELGQGNTNQYTGAVEVQGQTGTAGALSNIKMVAAGQNFCLALGTDGTVYSWGFSNEGQLGDGGDTSSHPRSDYSASPAPVVGTNGMGNLTGVAAIAAGYTNGYALMPDGNLLAWGSNFGGTTGQGGTIASNYSVSNLPSSLYVPTLVKDQTGNSFLSLAPLSPYPNLLRYGNF